MKPRRSAASLLARLLERAKQNGEDYSLVLNRFGLERLLDGQTNIRNAISHLAISQQVDSCSAGACDHPLRSGVQP